MSVSCFLSLSNTWGAYHRFNMDCERLLLQKSQLFKQPDKKVFMKNTMILQMNNSTTE